MYNRLCGQMVYSQLVCDELRGVDWRAVGGVQAVGVWSFGVYSLCVWSPIVLCRLACNPLVCTRLACRWLVCNPLVCIRLLCSLHHHVGLSGGLQSVVCVAGWCVAGCV
jgi:hypothetical protein